MKIKHLKTDCVFIGAPGHKGGARISKEHVFSEWMHGLVVHPKENWHLNQRGIPDRRPLLENRRRAGLTIHRTVKVCKSCNESWMRDIEDEARSALTPLIVGNPTDLALDQQLTIAKWLTLKAIAAEYDDLKNIGVTQRDRDAFFNTRIPLPKWQIYIGHYRGVDWQSRYHHNAFYLSEGGIRPPPGVRPLNAQLTILCYGQFFSFSVSNMAADAIVFPAWFDGPMHRIWPARTSAVRIPHATISDQDADEIMNFLPKAIRQLPARNRID